MENERATCVFIYWEFQWCCLHKQFFFNFKHNHHQLVPIMNRLQKFLYFTKRRRENAEKNQNIFWVNEGWNKQKKNTWKELQFRNSILTFFCFSKLVFSISFLNELRDIEKKKMIDECGANIFKSFFFRAISLSYGR